MTTEPSIYETTVIIGQVPSAKRCVQWEFDSTWRPELEYYLSQREFASHMYHINWITTTTFGPHPKRIAFLVIYTLFMGAMVPIFFLYLSPLWAYVFIAGIVSTLACGLVKYCRVKTEFKNIMKLVMEEKNNMHTDRNMQWILKHEQKDGNTVYWIEIYLFYEEEEYYEEEVPAVEGVEVKPAQQPPQSPKRSHHHKKSKRSSKEEEPKKVPRGIFVETNSDAIPPV